MENKKKEIRLKDKEIKYYSFSKEQEKLLDLAKKQESENSPFYYGQTSGIR